MFLRRPGSPESKREGSSRAVWLRFAFSPPDRDISRQFLTFRDGRGGLRGDPRAAETLGQIGAAIDLGAEARLLQPAEDRARINPQLDRGGGDG